MRCKVGDKVLVVYSPYRPDFVGLETHIVRAVQRSDRLDTHCDWIIDERHLKRSRMGLAGAPDAWLIPLRGDPDVTEQDEYDAIPDMPVG